MHIVVGAQTPREGAAMKDRPGRLGSRLLASAVALIMALCSVSGRMLHNQLLQQDSKAAAAQQPASGPDLSDIEAWMDSSTGAVPLAHLAAGPSSSTPDPTPPQMLDSSTAASAAELNATAAAPATGPLLQPESAPGTVSRSTGTAAAQASRASLRGLPSPSLQAVLAAAGFDPSGTSTAVSPASKAAPRALPAPSFLELLGSDPDEDPAAAVTSASSSSSPSFSGGSSSSSNGVASPSTSTSETVAMASSGPAVVRSNLEAGPAADNSSKNAAIHSGSSSSSRSSTASKDSPLVGFSVAATPRAVSSSPQPTVGPIVQAMDSRSAAATNGCTSSSSSSSSSSLKCTSSSPSPAAGRVAAGPLRPASAAVRNSSSSSSRSSSSRNRSTAVPGTTAADSSDESSRSTAGSDSSACCSSTTGSSSTIGTSSISSSSHGGVGLSSGSSGSSSSSSSSAAASRPQSDLPPVAANAVAEVVSVGVPEHCIVAGSWLFSSCALEIYAAQTHFNISVPYLALQNYTKLLHDRGITRPKVFQYLREALAHPSNECCAAQCCFNQLLLCDCETSVLQVAVRFAGVDEAFYALMVAQLAASCGTKHFYGNSCPSSVSYPASDATACIGATPWPPIRQQQPAGSPTASAASPDDSQSQTARQGVGDVAVGGQVVCLASDSVDSTRDDPVKANRGATGGQEVVLSDGNV